MARHLVAGGGGFIGSHLVDQLIERGDDVTIVDNFVTGRAANIAHLSDDRRVRIVTWDVTTAIPDDLLSERFDSVLNLASPASPDDFLTLSLQILAAGAAGTRNLLELAVHHSATFFQASTSEVYGDPLVHPQPESYLGNVSSTGPRSCYDEAKRYGEALTMAYHRVHGLEVRIARIFNTYGERMRPRDGRVVNTFVRQALNDEPLTLHGDGSQTRSFCHVADEVRGLVAVLDGQLNVPVNVGNAEECSMLELAELVIELTGSTSTIQRLPLPAEREGDPARRCPDTTLIEAAFGWKPRISLREGLARMIEHFRQHEDLS